MKFEFRPAMKFFTPLFILFMLLFCAREGALAEAWPATRFSKADTAVINDLNRRSWSLRREDPGKAMAQAAQALKLSEKAGYTEGKAFALKSQGAISWIRGDYRLAGEKYRGSLKLFKESRNDKETGNLYNLVGLLQWNLGKYPEAVISYQRAVKIFHLAGDTEGEAYVYNNLGIIYYELGNLDEALRQYEKGLRIYERLNDPFILSNVYNNIGLIYSDQGNYRRALRYFGASLRIDLKSRNLSGQIKSFSNIGAAYFRQGDLQKAEQKHLQAMEISRRLGDKKGISDAMINISEIYLRQRKIAEAENYLHEALEMKREIGEALGESFGMICLGRVRIAQRLPVEAIKCMTEAYRIAEEIGSLKYRKDAAYHLSQLYESSGKQEEALKYYKAYVFVSDSIQRQLAGNRLLDMQIASEIRKQEQRAALWKKEAGIKDERRKELAGAIVFLTLLSVLLIGRQSMKHRKEKKIAALLIETQCSSQRALELEVANMELEIEFNRRTLMAYTQKLIEKNALVESLLEAGVTAPDEKTASIDRLVESRIVTEDDWQEFKKLYGGVYPRFMALLKERFPAITQADLRLAALITLKLSTREIAAVLGISGDSVKKSRQRLRRKMSLEPGEDLDELLQQWAEAWPKDT